ncbi:MAG: hypothetical protein KA215_07760, partial [Flavobacterium sp.]|nr:hypothetical protein [Flavobacterium sp.]
SESVETQPQALTIPEWLKGNYEGVHTKENLVISNQKITFKVEQTVYEFEVNQILSHQEEENRFIIQTASDILIFNKTTLQTEINFQFNELYLGWFRKRLVQ